MINGFLFLYFNFFNRKRTGKTIPRAEQLSLIIIKKDSNHQVIELWYEMTGRACLFFVQIKQSYDNINLTDHFIKLRKEKGKKSFSFKATLGLEAISNSIK